MKHTDLHDIHQACQLVNEVNTRRMQRSENIAGLILVIILGSLGGWLLVKWATPCEAGALCTVALLPTRHRFSPLRKVWRWLQGRYWHMRLRSVEADIAALDTDEEVLCQQLQIIPEQRTAWRLYADALQVRIVDLDLQGRMQ